VRLFRFGSAWRRTTDISVSRSSTTGRGFDTAETSYGTGVQGMADRLDAIGGALQVVSRRDAGTTIEGQIPTPTSSDA
jgi:glucose-6-phosphate-specific signal transduction histidine kinase